MKQIIFQQYIIGAHNSQGKIKKLHFFPCLLVSGVAYTCRAAYRSEKATR
jgi:hypothetical protein